MEANSLSILIVISTIFLFGVIACAFAIGAAVARSGQISQDEEDNE